VTVPTTKFAGKGGAQAITYTFMLACGSWRIVLITARRHASAVYAVVVCLSVCVSVFHKFMFY